MAMDRRESAIAEEKERSEMGQADTVVQRQRLKRMEIERSERNVVDGRKRNIGESGTRRRTYHRCEV